MRRLPVGSWVAIAFASALTLGCEKEPSSEPLAVADAGKAAAVDPALAQAVAAASAGHARPGAPPAQTGGPPPGGVFEPAAADKEMPRGAPPKVVLGSEGSAPRVTLTPPTFKAGVKRTAKLEVELQMGPRPLPPLAVTISSVAKPDPTKPEAPVPMTVSITNARFAGAGLPPDLSNAFAQLKGSKLEFQLLPGGAAGDVQYQLAKGADPGLDNTLRALAGSLSSSAVPMPEKPIGVGGYWMVTSRENLGGLETISYRMYKVAGVEPSILLDVTTKRYATDRPFKMSGLQSDTALNLEELDYSGQGRLEIERGEVVSSELTERMTANVVPQNQPTQRATVQFQSRVKLAPGP